MTSHFKTGRFGRGPTEQRPRLSPTRTGGRSLRSEGRIDYESEATHDPTGGGLLFPSTYYKSDRSDRRDLQNENQRVTEVGFRARVGLKRPKRPVIHARFAVPQGVICAPPAPKRPRARAWNRQNCNAPPRSRRLPNRPRNLLWGKTDGNNRRRPPPAPRSRPRGPVQALCCPSGPTNG